MRGALRVSPEPLDARAAALVGEPLLEQHRLHASECRGRFLRRLDGEDLHDEEVIVARDDVNGVGFAGEIAEFSIDQSPALQGR